MASRDEKRRRKQRKRAKKRQKGGEARGYARGSIVTLHFRPSEVPEHHTGLMLAQLADAYRSASNLKVIKEEWPLHVELRFGSACICGTVEPGDEGLPEAIVIGPDVSSGVVH